MSDDIFAEIGNATVPQGNPWVKQGVYPVVQLNGMKIVTSQKPGTKGDKKFVGTVDILVSENPDLGPGLSMDFIRNLRREASAADVKAFIAAFSGMESDQIDADGVKLAMSADQPLNGRLASLKAFDKPNQNNDGKFTVTRWTALPEDVQATASELRSKAGFPPF